LTKMQLEVHLIMYKILMINNLKIKNNPNKKPLAKVSM